MRSAVFALVAAGHVALLAWLGLRAPQTTMAVMDEPTAVEVFVLPPPPRPEQRAGRPVSSLRPRMALPPPVGVVAVPEPLPTVEAPPPPFAPGAPSEQTRTALRRSLINCLDTARIGPEDRAFCEERRAGIRTTDASVGPVLAPDKQARFDNTASAKRVVKAYKNCATIAECDALYPGLRAMAKDALGAQ